MYGASTRLSANWLKIAEIIIGMSASGEGICLIAAGIIDINWATINTLISPNFLTSFYRPIAYAINITPIAITT